MNPKSSESVCIIVENEAAPFDRRVWLEACALSEAGYGVSVICPKSTMFEKSRETVDGIEIFRHRGWRAQGKLGYIFEYGWALIAEFYLALIAYKRTRFRVLQVCNPPDTAFLIGLFFKLLGVRFVFDHHDLSPELYSVKFGRRGLVYRAVCLAEWLTFRTADMSLATNESFREIAIMRGGMKPERVVVVQTCADLREIDPVVNRPELKQGNPYLVVYVGNMGVQDDVDLLLKSIDHILNQAHRRDILFVLIGQGSEVPRLKALSAQWGLTEKVKFTGCIPHNEVGPYLSAADVCVASDSFNPLNDKCSMIKIFEYMAYAKPTVLYDLKEGRRSAGHAGLYASPNDSRGFAEQILRLLDSESLRQELGQIGRGRVEEWLNWETQSCKLLKAYSTLLSTDTSALHFTVEDKADTPRQRTEDFHESVRHEYAPSNEPQGE
jgi:glycosyltransferase involved in cell wall biosynthesis